VGLTEADAYTHSDAHQWWGGNNSPDGTKEVGLKLPNPWGLHDMHGNVWEWCADWWQAPHSRGSQVDPTGPQSGSDKVLRGGSWNSYDSEFRSCRSANRVWYRPTNTNNNGIGLRLARTP